MKIRIQLIEEVTRNSPQKESGWNWNECVQWDGRYEYLLILNITVGDMAVTLCVDDEVHPIIRPW